MNKIIGVLTGWGVEDWIHPAINQALEFCDETMVIIAPYAPEFKKFEDRTYEICKEYPVRLLDYEPSSLPIGKQRCRILNTMLRKSRLFAPGNWIWLFDSDEFYLDSGYAEVMEAIRLGKYDRVYMESKFFIINMQHYLIEASERLFKIATGNDEFIPTNNWCHKAKNSYTLKRVNGMFHYSMLTDARIHEAQWWLFPPFDEYGGYRVRWLKEIYAKYDLENEDYWTEKNRELIGIKTPWCDDGYKPDENGRLFRYTGKHPKFIEKAGLTKIKDFREYNKRRKK
ncbi:hypothetical protein ES703_116560 [subsurface metagenome]